MLCIHLFIVSAILPSLLLCVTILYQILPNAIHTDSDLLTIAQMQQSDQTFSAVSIMSIIV